MKDQTIEDIDKVKKTTLEKEMSQDENLGGVLEPYLVKLKRSNRERQSSTRYTYDEYVTLIDGEKPECY
ncbi:hypothetical protein CR513_28031, partial [Mucuna pruriens]